MAAATMEIDEGGVDKSLHRYNAVLPEEIRSKIPEESKKMLETIMKDLQQVASGLDSASSIDVGLAARTTKWFRTLERLIAKRRGSNLEAVLTIQWKPYYQRLVSLYFTNLRMPPASSSGLERQHKRALVSFLWVARHYFPEESGDEIYQTFVPIMKANTYSMEVLRAQGFLLLFLPTMNVPYKPQYVEEMIDVWASIDHCNEWETHWFVLMCRAVKALPPASVSSGSQTVDWSKYEDFLFSRVLTALNLQALSDGAGAPSHRSVPSLYTIFLKSQNYSHTLMRKMAKLIVLLMPQSDSANGGSDKDSPSSVALRLQELLHRIRTYYHPSNTGRWSERLGAFLASLTAQLARRLGRDSGLGVHPMMKADVLLVINCTLELALQALYSKSASLVAMAQHTVRHCAILAPEIVEKQATAQIYLALDPLSTHLTHQAPSIIKTLSLVLKPLLSPLPVISPHLPSLLQLTLPGIDASDISKTLSTLNFYSVVLDWIPLINEPQDPTDGNYAPSVLPALSSWHKLSTITPQDKLDEKARELFQSSWRGNHLVGEWSLELLDKFLVVIRNRERPAKGSWLSNQSNDAVSYMIHRVCSQLFSQMSPELYTIALRKVYGFVTTTFVPDVAKDTSRLLSAITFAHPQESLAKLVPDFFRQIVRGKNKDGEAVLSESSDQELTWYIRLLGGVVKEAGHAILTYKQEFRTILSLTVSHKNKKVRKSACKLLRQLLRSLVEFYPTEVKSASPQQFLKGDEWKYWAKDTPWEELGLQWHSPTPEELFFAEELMNLYLVNPLDTLSKAINTTSSSHDAELWRATLRVIFHATRGSVAILKDSLPPETAASSQLSSLRQKLARFCHEAFQFFTTDPERERDTKSLVKLVQLMEYLITCRGAHVGKSQLKEQMLTFVKRLFSDRASDHEAVYAMRKKAKTHPDPTGLEYRGLRRNHPRLQMIDRVAIQLQRRLTEESYRVPREMHRTNSPLQKVYNDLLEDLISLSFHSYSQVRKIAQSSVQSAFSRFPWALKERLGSLLEILNPNSDSSGDKVTGAVFLLQQERSMRYICTDWRYLSTLMKILCTSNELVMRMPTERQEKTQARLQGCFISFVGWMQNLPVTGRRDSDIKEQLIQDLLALGKEGNGNVLASTAASASSQLHWRYDMMRIVCLLFAHSETDPIRGEVWKEYIRLIQSDIDPVQKLGLLSLSRALAVHRNQEKASLAGLSKHSEEMKDVKALLVDISFLEKLARALTLDHKEAHRAADGEAAGGRSSAQWSAGIDVILREAMRHRATYPYTRHSLVSPNFAVRHANLMKGLLQFIGWKFFTAFAPHLEFLCVGDGPLDEQRIRLCAGAETIAGFVRAATHPLPPPSLKEDPSSTFLSTSFWPALIDLLGKTLSNVNLDWTADWVDTMRFSSHRRHHSALAPLQSFIVDRLMSSLSAASTKDEFSSQARWLRLVQALLIEFAAFSPAQEGEIALAEMLAPTLLQSLDHPYHSCRLEVGRCLFLISCQKPQLGQSSDSAALNKLQQRFLVLSEGLIPKVIGTLHLANAENSWNAPTSAGDVINYAHLLAPLLPVVLQSQNYSDVELQHFAKHSLLSLAHGVRCNFQKDRASVLETIFDSVIPHFYGSSSWHTRIATLRFISAFSVYHCFVLRANLKEKTMSLFIAALLDKHREVQDAGRMALTAFVSGLQEEEVAALSATFLSLATKSLKMRKRHKRLMSTDNLPDAGALEKVVNNETKGVLGLSALVLAYPYEVPAFVPEAVTELVSHINSPVPAVKASAKHTLSDFKRTHHDNWNEHKLKFTASQLDILSDSLGSPHYYA